ncbi:MAG: AMP-binding protein [Bryobacterales bacterium]|nr:AMP-binding protein [Bryobacterales bacterium]
MADLLKESSGVQPAYSAPERLFAVVKQLVSELHPGRRDRVWITAASRLERDLAIDSLGRAELLRRIERTFDVRLPDGLLGTAESIADLLAGLAQNTSAAGGPDLVSVASADEGVAATPSAAATLIDVLEAHAAHEAGRTHILLTDDPPGVAKITYGGLFAAAREVTAGLMEHDVTQDDRVAMMLPTGADFFEGFFGALCAGATPVPIYPPARLSQLEDHLRRQAAILNNAEAEVLITVPEARGAARLLRALVPSLRFVGTVSDLKSDGRSMEPVTLRSDDTALLQYTSGSTGDPKGVVLSHRNLLANLRAIGEVMHPGPGDTVVSWLPLYHDMGLIGAWLGSLYYAVPLVLMSPLTFLSRPERWLWAIHQHRGTISAAPNFAFEICATKVEDDQIEGLDLSSARILMNGAEPVSGNSIRKFSERFKPYGLRPEAVTPVYGMAENSLALTTTPPERPPPVDRIRRSLLMTRGEAVPAGSVDEGVLEVVSCGRALPRHHIRILDDAGREVGERCVGRIQFRGPSATSGYFHNEEKTRELIRDGWLESGDRGYLANGEVHITGRSKDIIIRAGRNIYPHEVEEAIGQIENVRKGCVAVFGMTDAETGIERVIVVAETRLEDKGAKDAVRSEIERLSTEIMDALPDDVVLARPQTVPKTSSGKIRRSSTRELYEQGLLEAGPRAVWKQVASLALGGVASGASRFIRGTGRWLYGIHWWFVIAGCVLGTWLSMLILPKRARWTAVRTWGRLILGLTFTKTTLEGAQLTPDRGGVVVVNHASYLDSIVVAAMVPGPLSFVVKDDLSEFKWFRSFLERMDALFVQRLDVAASVEDAGKVIEAARAGRRIAVFPEGTFIPRDGLLPFRLGAFVVAAETQTPVIPVALRGTRHILRDEHWLPKRGSVHVKILPLISPQGSGFSEAIRLRNAARAAILPHCGEPDRGDEQLLFTAAGVERI